MRTISEKKEMMNAMTFKQYGLGLFALSILFLQTTTGAWAREITGLPDAVPGGRTGKGNFYKMAAGCEAAKAQVDLDINNVRTTILTGGDMWWNLVNAKYEIPKVTDPKNTNRKHALFSGALWIGGLAQGNLKLAAQTYRQNGNDYFPGPLNTSTASILSERCTFYDRIYKITRKDIEEFVKNPDKTNPTTVIQDWPGNGNPAFGEAEFLAPYVNVGGTLRYEPQLGDYPNVLGDMTLWWVYNDRGNIHSETQAVPIGLELQTQAFAFVTNDEINNMTFYTTVIANRSNEDVDSCYFGEWVDADLGNYADDYVGCDVGRSLGYCYNGDEDDEGVLGYGQNPPSVGVDFFEGPFADLGDGVDNDRNGLTDEPGEKIGMSKFVYYNNDGSADRGNPSAPQHYYNYLRGIWKDGVRISYGGNGKGAGLGATGVICDFMFPGNTDLSKLGTLGEWTERTAGNPPADRRFLQSAGPFKLKAGAVNKVTVGVVWARVSQGGATGSLELLKRSDDKAQKLFNNAFNIVDGPDAPDLNIVELNRQLIINLENTESPETYIGKVLGASGDTIRYAFEGYQIYQLKDATVTTSELDDVDKARLVGQVDLLNDVDKIVNVEFDPIIEDNNKVLKVLGENKGVRHSFKINKDLFAKGDQTLVNFKTYYYLILSYAHAQQQPNEPEQYLAGRKNIKVYNAVPHPSQPRNGGTFLTSDYGSGPQITRVVGTGNGGNALELTQATVDAILKSDSGRVYQPTYAGGKGPVNIKVIDPTKVPLGDFEIYLVDSFPTTPAQKDSLAPNSRWYLVRKNIGSPNDTIFSDTNMSVKNEQLLKYRNPVTGKLEDWGMSVTINQTIKPGKTDDLFDRSNGYITSSMEFADESKPWLTGVKDADNTDLTNSNYIFNWIRSGIFGRNDNFDQQGDNAYRNDYGNSTTDAFDPREQYEKVLDGRMAPYRLCASKNRNTAGRNTYGPAWTNFQSDTRLSDLSSIDLVLTSDKSKWTRCCVIELGEDANLNEGKVPKMGLRAGKSVDKNGNPGDGIVTNNPEDADYIAATGMGWFPGYAINLETGERLNIMFGEDSYYEGDNGRDMIWNPTSTFLAGQSNPIIPIYGGKHYIYVMGRNRGPQNYVGPAYDAGKTYQALFAANNPNDQQRKLYSQAQWVMMSYKAPGYSLLPPELGIVPTDVKIKVRIQKPYARFNQDPNTVVNQNMPVYKFSTNTIAPVLGKEYGKSAIDLINIVPNPYYGASGYERNQLDTKVKITNLPPTCTISIYTLNGVLVRRIRKDDPTTTYVDWDIQNSANVPIASGVYIVHIDAGALGEKVLKWFGVMRQYDLDSF